MLYNQPRLTRLRQKMSLANTDTMLITCIYDIAWLSGFTGSTAYILVTQHDALFATDGRYEIQATGEVDAAYEIIVVASYTSFFKDICRKFKTVTLQQSASVGFMMMLKDCGADVKIEKTETLLGLRIIKDNRDIEGIRQEYARAAKAFLSSIDTWQYGQKEIEWAATLEYNMKMLGAKGASFDTIIASGARGALPHGVASDKIIDACDPITIDFGTQGEYASDYTRVVYSGVNKKVLDIIDIVRTALEKAKDSVKPGLKCFEIDAVARDYIESKGYGKYFNHSLGHGVGKEVHEQPLLNKLSHNVIEAGMVFTIEPGIYLPGECGVRLEETVIVNDFSCELLSSMLDKYVYVIK